MKKSAVLVIFIAILLLTDCTNSPASQAPTAIVSAPSEAVNTATSTETPTPQPIVVNLDLFKNSMIFAPELKKSVQLVDGKWSENQSDGSKQMVMLENHFAVGDLNSDGVEDAAVVVVESMGGSGVFYSVAAFVNEGGTFVQKDSVFIDDRPVVHSIEITNGEIQLNANVHGLNDPMVDPTVNLVKTYRLIGDKLVTFRQTQLLTDGKVREINITVPADFSEASGSVTITGDMPIAPFENTLLVQVFNEKNTVSFTKSIMVNAADVGQPATFSVNIPLDKFTAGDLVIVQLVEVSMADGSNMTLDSVSIRVR